MTRPLSILAGILLLTALVYSRVSAAYFCGYDDFIEIHRAGFEDTAEPIKILTTTHYNSFKYRPLSRALNLVTYLANKNEATQFRIRNLISHCLAVSAMFWLGCLIFNSVPIASAAALLFSIYPLANQPVIAAVFTNTTANALLLLSLAIFILSAKKNRLSLLILSLVCGVISLYIYESGIVLAGLMASWLAFDYLFARRRPTTPFLLVFLLLGGSLFGSYLVARHFFVSANKTALSPPGTMVKNSVLYFGSLALPIDPVLGNTLFGTPLPSEIRMDSGSGRIWIATAGILVIAVGILLFAMRKPVIAWARGLEWGRILFLLSGMVLFLSPFLVFTDHASETYAYLPGAFYCLLLAYLLSTIPSRQAFAVATGVLAFLFCAATMIRNQQVVRCATTAKTILSNLPTSLREGPWLLYLAKAPGEPAAPRYGFYSYYGLDTLGTGSYGLQGVQFATQDAYHNAQITTEILPLDEWKTRCGTLNPREACFMVHSDGRVSEFGKPIAAK